MRKLILFIFLIASFGLQAQTLGKINSDSLDNVGYINGVSANYYGYINSDSVYYFGGHHTLDNNIYAYYKLADTTDNVGNIYPLTNDGTSDAEGIIDRSRLFDGTNDRMYRNNTSDFNFSLSDKFTISLWIYDTDINNPRGLFSRLGGSPDTGFDARLANFGTGRRVYFYLRGNSVYDGVYTPNNSYSGSTWVHLVFTYDGSGDATGLKIYINGTLPTNNRTTNGTVSSISSSANLTFGVRYTEYFKGNMAEIGIWDYVKTPKEIEDLYSNGIGLTR